MGVYSSPGDKFVTLSTTENRQKFLEALANEGAGSVTRACKICNVERMGAYRLKHEDPQFSEQWDVAQKLGEDAMEDEARRRAIEGVEQPIYKNGEVVGRRIDYSDILMIFLLKGAKPEKYKDRVENINFNRDLDLADKLKSARTRVAPAAPGTEKEER